MNTLIRFLFSLSVAVVVVGIIDFGMASTLVPAGYRADTGQFQPMGAGDVMTNIPDWNEAVTTAADYIKNKPANPNSQSYLNTTQLFGEFPVFLTGTTNSSGQVVFNLTNDGTSTGTALFLSGPITSSFNFIVSSAASFYTATWAWSNSNKTLTLSVYQTGSTNALLNLLGGLTSVLGAAVAAPAGVSINASVWGK